MRMKQVIKYCRDNGHPITAMAIYLAGKKYGFIKKINGKWYLEFDKQKFLDWFKGFTVEIPEGYVSVKDLAESFDLSIQQCYNLIKDNSIKKMRKGTGEGILYVDKESFGEFINIRKCRDEEVFG